MNRGCAYVADTIGALAEAGLEELAEVLEGAVSASPTLAAVVRGEVEEPAWISGAEEAKLKLYDALALEALPGVDTSLLNYLRRHWEEVLVPERGGPESR